MAFVEETIRGEGILRVSIHLVGTRKMFASRAWETKPNRRLAYDAILSTRPRIARPSSRRIRLPSISLRGRLIVLERMHALHPNLPGDGCAFGDPRSNALRLVAVCSNPNTRLLGFVFMFYSTIHPDGNEVESRRHPREERARASIGIEDVQSLLGAGRSGRSKSQVLRSIRNERW